jgi:DNA-binding NtrC family response regulator
MIRTYYLEDDNDLLQFVKLTLQKSSFKVSTFESSATLAVAMKKALPDLLLLDINIGESISGIELAKRFARIYPDLVIVMYSAADDNQTMIRGFRAGIDSYISKETPPRKLADALRSAYETARLTRGSLSTEELNTKLRAITHHTLPPLIGKTMASVASKLISVCQSSVDTLHISGESGTGKDVVASFVESLRPKHAPFIKINLGEIPPTLFESTLFGHRRGAFTGALESKPGLIEGADGGWLFLDEIGTLPLSAQASLLRVIANKELRRVGDVGLSKINFRLISATHEDLGKLVKEGKFREDLWNRIRDPMIVLPPLRDRGNGELIELLTFFAKTTPGGPYSLSPSLLRILSSYEWREGNTREMEKMVRAMTPFAGSNKTLTEQMLPRQFWERVDPELNLAASTVDDPVKVVIDLSEGLAFDGLIQKLFKETVKRLYGQHGSKLKYKEIAKILEISPNTVTRRMRGYDE